MQFSDDELMRKVKECDISAFDALVRRWENSLLNLIYRITGSFEAAEDLCQEVFLKVYQTAGRYRSMGNFRAWLYRIAVNCAINELKGQKGRQEVRLTVSYHREDGSQQLAEDNLADPNPGPDEMLQQKEIAECVQDALGRLPHKERIVIVLKLYEGMRFQQIASIVNCPVSTVKSRMYKGMDRLRTMLKHFHQSRI